MFNWENIIVFQTLLIIELVMKAKDPFCLSSTACKPVHCCVSAPGGSDRWSWQVSGGVSKVLRRSGAGKREQCSLQGRDATAIPPRKTRGMRKSSEAFLVS